MRLDRCISLLFASFKNQIRSVSASDRNSLHKVLQNGSYPVICICFEALAFLFVLIYNPYIDLVEMARIKGGTHHAERKKEIRY